MVSQYLDVFESNKSFFWVWSRVQIRCTEGEAHHDIRSFKENAVSAGYSENRHFHSDSGPSAGISWTYHRRTSSTGFEKSGIIITMRSDLLNDRTR